MSKNLSKYLFVISIISLLNFSFLSCQADKLQIKNIGIEPIVAPFDMPQLSPPNIPSKIFDIREFGAKEGGAYKNTDVIRNAISKATQSGGGIVLIPKGTWLTGAIHLDNNIDLHLEKDAVLLFSQETSDYLPVVFSRHEDIECYKYSSFIYANNKTNISITGEGILNGQGKPWWQWKESKKDIEKLLNQMSDQNIPVEERKFDGTDGKELRPAFFQPMNCKNILVEGVTFLYGAFWTITPTYCENIIIRNVRIETEGAYGHTPNGDGVNPSSCRNVLIEGCDFNTGDDCIAIKAGRDKDGLRVNKPSENIVIRNCSGLNGHGGIVIGSETSGGVRNVYAVNCKFKGTDRVVRIKTARGRGGIIENMWFKELTGENILKEAIHLNMLYTGTRLPAQPVSATTPIIRNINLENINILSGESYAIEILGLPERTVDDIQMNKIISNASKGINISDANRITIKNSNITSGNNPTINIIDTKEVRIEDSEIFGKGKNLVEVAGANSGNIRFKKTNLKAESIKINSEVSDKAVGLD
ncbi:MAG: glycoside hydrolase family 28 protein [Ignavibacteriales bacterium]|nr:glycoside hydrolase family 28 protein [Ignavibacteriales bacterium]